MNLAGTFLKNRALKVESKTALAVAKIRSTDQRAQRMPIGENSALMSASQDSIKDELWTILFIGLIVVCFYSGGANPYIADGFRFLQEISRLVIVWHPAGHRGIVWSEINRQIAGLKTEKIHLSSFYVLQFVTRCAIL